MSEDIFSESMFGSADVVGLLVDGNSFEVLI
jgi:hypothetical protein